MTEQVAEPVPRRERSVWTWLFNPFHYVAGGAALGAGLGVMVVAGLVASLSYSHFDGALDFHSAPPEMVKLLPGAQTNPLLLERNWWLPVVEAMIGWLSLSVVVLGAGRLVSRSRFRVLDVFGTQALARFPTLFMALVVLLPGFQEQVLRLMRSPMNPSFDATGLVSLLGVALVMIVSSVWMIVLMYKAFSVSCNTSGGKAIAAFIGALILGEVLSKIALGGFFSVLERMV